MKIKDIGLKFLYVCGVAASIIVLFFVIAASWIGYEVKDQCRSAKREYKSDCVTSLMALVKDENKNFRTRNEAVWALGQFGDPKALPVLKSLYTGIIPERELLDETLSQYELKKAINLTSGGINISAFIWRNGVFLP